MFCRYRCHAICALLIGIVSLVTASSRAAVLWDEAVNGDLSNDRLSPTAFVLAPGTNSLVGGVEHGELDYVSVKVLPGQEFVALVLASFVGNDSTAFIAIQSGTTFTAAPPFPNPNTMLGYAHFGPGGTFGAQVGNDLFYAMSKAGGAMGFSSPLASGDYSFWIQQTGEHTDYQFDFIVVPEPASLFMAGCGIAGLLLLSRRRK